MSRGHLKYFFVASVFSFRYWIKSWIKAIGNLPLLKVSELSVFLFSSTKPPCSISLSSFLQSCRGPKGRFKHCLGHMSWPTAFCLRCQLIKLYLPAKCSLITFSKLYVSSATAITFEWPWHPRLIYSRRRRLSRCLDFVIASLPNLSRRHLPINCYLPKSNLTDLSILKRSNLLT